MTENRPTEPIAAGSPSTSSRPVTPLPSPEFLQLLRGEITAREWVDWAERQCGYDTQEAFDTARGLSAHARWWFARGALLGFVVGFGIEAVLHA